MTGIRSGAAASVMGLVMSLALAVPAGAQQDAAAESLRARYRIVLPPGFADRPAFVRSLPATNASTPSGFGPQWGDVFVGAGYQHNTRSTGRAGALGANNGAVVAGFGLGSARMIGLEVAFTSFSTLRSGFFSRTGVSFKAHHQFTSGWSVAVGSETAFVLGEAGDGGRANYLAASRVLTVGDNATRPFRTIGVTVGAGDGRYRPLADVRADRRTLGAFGAVSARLSSAVGAVADWNGQDLTLSASVVPLRCLPITITPGLTDVTRNAGGRPRWVVGMGVGLRPDQLRARLRDCF